MTRPDGHINSFKSKEIPVGTKPAEGRLGSGTAHRRLFCAHGVMQAPRPFCPVRESGDDDEAKPSVLVP